MTSRYRLLDEGGPVTRATSCGSNITAFNVPTTSDARLGTPLDGLKEIHLGELEGITGPVMRENYPEVFHTWNNNPSRVSFPGGESLRQLQRRAWRAAQHIESTHPPGDLTATVVAVSHNFAINAIVSRFLGLPLSRFHRIRVDLGSFTVLDIGERYRHLLHFNDRCHLIGLPASGG